jgi:uncharacterized protein (DUF1810 family)
MKVDTTLERFISAQENKYSIALSEIKSGLKSSHWMWYIFPQLIGLGNSYKSEFYGINGLQEAKEYINHPILGIRLREITRELLSLNGNDAEEIVGFPDCLKLKSSMTLFNLVDESEDKLFKSVLDKYYNGEYDEQTLELLTDS